MLGKGTFKKLRQAVDAGQSAPSPLEALTAARQLREAAGHWSWRRSWRPDAVD
ncbi:MAG: hypothetical protein M3Z25_11660 [Actinomycetota bacterium]|nr:hypothetical protein [Actinomycetota bacterium]